MTDLVLVKEWHDSDDKLGASVDMKARGDDSRFYATAWLDVASVLESDAYDDPDDADAAFERAVLGVAPRAVAHDAYGATNPPMVYVAGPFSAKTRDGVEKNIRRAERWGLCVARMGGYPVVPHANTSHPDYESAQPYQFWIDGTMSLMLSCHAVLMIDGWERSSGARGERDLALQLNIPVFHGIDELVKLRSWLKEKRT